MILRRLGNKKAIAPKIIAQFPDHRIYIEPFFGAGGIFFYKPRAKYNLLNDLDADVANLWDVYFNRKDELIEAVEVIPYHEKLFQDWRTKTEDEPIRKALRFLFLSNFGYMGQDGIMDFRDQSHKKELLKNCKKTLLDVTDVQFMNTDFRKCFKKWCFLPQLSKRGLDGKRKTSLDVGLVFIYNDPPYLSTTNNYSCGKDGWSKQDLTDLIELNIKSGAKFAISEFDNEEVIELAKSYNLNIINIVERRTIKSRNTEILITNYKLNNTLF